MVALAVVAGALAAWLLAQDTSRLARLANARSIPTPVAPRPGGLRGPPRVAVSIAVGMVGPVLVGGPRGLALGLGLAWVGFYLAAWLPSRADERLNAALIAEQPTALDFLAAALCAGLPLGVALRRVADISPPATRDLLERISNEGALGRTDADAWAALPPNHPWNGVAQDLVRSRNSGTMLADLLVSHARLGRRRRSDRARQAAKRVGVQIALPLMLCFLPAFLAVGVAPMVVGLLSGLVFR